MIWFRRILTIPLIIFFAILLVVVLLMTQVNDTVGNPRFYNEQLRQADIYNFVYDELLPAALDEIDTEDSSEIPIDISAIEDEVVSAASKILPPEWLQAQVESATSTLIPYLLDNKDSFTYTLALKDRVETAARVVKEDILGGDAFAVIYDEGMSYLADKAFENLDELPYALTLSEEAIEGSLRSVVPRGWMASEAGAAVDSVAPYMTGDSDHFTITVQLRDRLDAAAAAAIQLLAVEGTYDYLLDELVTPIIDASLASIVDLPYGISFTRDEIASAVKEVLPHSWLQARLGEVINAVAAYLKGEADTIQLTVDLAERKAAAVDVVADLADGKLEAMFDSLPECSMVQFLYVVQTLPPDTLPDCRPTGVSYEEAKYLLNIDIGDWVDQFIGDRIPDRWVYTDSDLRRLLGEDNGDFLDQAREWVSGGWTFTDADLADKLGSDGKKTLEDARGWIASGYTVTETDLRDAIADTEEDLEAFDSARRWASTARTWLWTLWLIPLLLLACIGLLGGRNWRSRLAWALVVLLITSLAVYIGIGVTYARMAEPRLQEITLDSSQYEGVEAVMAQKGNEMIENAASGFVSGIQSKTLYMMIASAVGLVGIIGWSVARRQEETGPE